MSKNPISKFLFGVMQMPLMDHWPGKDGGVDFDPAVSEVIRWLSRDMGAMQWLFEKMRERGLIIYDSEKGGWEGRLISARTVDVPLRRTVLAAGPRKRMGRPRGQDYLQVLNCPGLETGISAGQLMVYLCGLGLGHSRSVLYRRLIEMEKTGLIEKVGTKWRTVKMDSGPSKAAATFPSPPPESPCPP